MLRRALPGFPAGPGPGKPEGIGEVAFITGAGRAIGAAAARLFARKGAWLLLAARTEDQLKAVTEEIRAAGGPARSPPSPTAPRASGSTPSLPAPH
ncbi:SDR family NAD(P)-dependent oxidoreductase [Nonomuraea rhodomycinica]|uniref:SDR family NAD(P)-dependent oxidoreductase n=1 Tax=Nonomuraea rhodomycinica TaxID=1712872 RepID=UPI001FE315B8|nr:SDR family NAD(P)-dependent oxidoreductase [Nonomuraea rhodomycinica]